MKFTVKILLALTLISCKESPKQQSPLINGDTLNQNTHKQQKIKAKLGRPEAALILSSDNIKIFGDTTIEKKKIYSTSIRFEPYISFMDFQVDVVNREHKADLNFSSNKEAYNFRTRIQDAYISDTVNFAGHYIFISWGCGSPCQSGVIVDRRTGDIYDAPSASLGYDFKANSRMLILNPPDSSGFYDDYFYGKPAIYLWDEESKKFIEKIPK